MGIPRTANPGVGGKRELASVVSDVLDIGDIYVDRWIDGKMAASGKTLPLSHYRYQIPYVPFPPAPISKQVGLMLREFSRYTSEPDSLSRPSIYSIV